jgi:hypothetical protein
MTYKQFEDDRSASACGTQFKLCYSHYLPYTVKLEAAKVTGYRTLLMSGIRDPVLISQLDGLLVRAK